MFASSNNRKWSHIDKEKENCKNHITHMNVLSLCAIGAGILCLFAYHRSFDIQSLLVQFLRGNFQLFEKYAFSHDSQVYETMGLYYLNVLIWLLPAWILLAFGLLGFARMCWLRPIVSFISRYCTCFAIALAIMASLCSLGVATFVLEQNPVTIGDEYGYTFQAKLFASGRIYGTAGANMEEFSNWAIVTNGPRRYNVHLPGHPLILVLGLLAGNVYLIPSLLAGISVLLLFFITKDLFSKGTALIAAVLMATSPFYLMFHGTLLPQTSLIPCLLLFLLCAIRISKREEWYWCVIAGSTLALATCIRPPSVILFAGPIGLYLMLLRDLPVRRRILVAFIGILSVLFGATALCVYSSHTSGQPLSFTLSGMSAHPPGEGPFSGKLGFSGRVNHTPIRGIVNTGKALIGWNYLLFGWPISFIPIAVWIFKRGKSGWEYVFMGSVICYYIFYFFWHASLWHYYLDTVPLFALVSASTINRCRTRNVHEITHIHLEGEHDYYNVPTLVSNEECVPGMPQIEKSDTGQVPRLFHMLLIVGVMLSLFSWPSSLAYFRNRNAPRRRVSEAICKANLENAIVLLENLPKEMYSSIGRNSPDLDDDVILARKLPGSRWHRTIALFPDRRVWILRIDAYNWLICTPYRSHSEAEPGTEEANGDTAIMD